MLSLTFLVAAARATVPWTKSTMPDGGPGGPQSSVYFMTLTAQQPYMHKTLEELRWEDYQAGRKGNTSGIVPGGASAFGASASTFGGGGATGFGATTGSAFGAGGSGTSAFGQRTSPFGGAASATPAFGGAAATSPFSGFGASSTTGA